jgi:aryl-alcohol dehydrogenase-like predicted oxidoreductase
MTMAIDLSPRRVHGTDLKVSRLVLGAMTFGSQVDAAAAARMVHRARESGITMFDTANTYNAGKSEEILGQIVGPFRHEVQIATKVGKSAPARDGLYRHLLSASARPAHALRRDACMPGRGCARREGPLRRSIELCCLADHGVS